MYSAWVYDELSKKSYTDLITGDVIVSPIKDTPIAIVICVRERSTSSVRYAHVYILRDAKLIKLLVSETTMLAVL